MNTTIQASLFKFLNTLEKNNNRAWFQENKTWYQEEETALKTFFEAVKNALEASDQIEKMKVFRIYRDVRFSKNKAPYKTNRSVSFSRATKALRGGYYLHISPGNSFVAGGFFGPEKEDLLRIRKEIELDAAGLKNIVNETHFKKHFKKLEGESLKSAPRGFDKNHPDIDLIKMKSFLAIERFDDEVVLSEDFYAKVVASLEALRPFFDYMSEVLTTNLNGESIID